MMPTHEDLNTVAMHNLSKACRLLPQRCYIITKMCFSMCVFYIHINILMAQISDVYLKILLVVDFTWKTVTAIMNANVNTSFPI